MLVQIATDLISVAFNIILIDFINYMGNGELIYLIVNFYEYTILKMHLCNMLLAFASYKEFFNDFFN